MKNKRIEMARRVGSSLAIIIYICVPFFFFLFVDTIIDTAGGYLIGTVWTILGLAIIVWFLDGEKDSEDENKKSQDELIDRPGSLD